MRDDLVEQIGALPIVGSALDHIIGHFGTQAVAEVTGRSRRIVVDTAGRQRIENRSPRTNLSSREIQVLELVADGRSNAEAAADLYVSETTIKSHLAHIYSKLNVTSRTAAVSTARQQGILR